MNHPEPNQAPSAPLAAADSPSAEGLSEGYRQRFGGIARLYGNAALTAFHGSHFVVVGIGGVGTWIAEGLARSGIGEITLIDMDDICITNTNRQIHALNSTVGQQKIAVMAERLKDINPDIKVNAVDEFLETDNLDELIPRDASVVIDAIDAAYVKAALINYCKRHKKIILTVGSAGGKLDPRQIISGDLSRTTNDPLLAKTRNTLRRWHNFSRNPKRVFSIEAVYSTEQMTYPAEDGGTCQAKSGLQAGTKLDCSGGFGAATMVTATFGFVAVSRALERFLHKQARKSQPPEPA
ncbi:tRNA cyclic N6-threonylcarbamoyladenosine(37) synthase TcdA [Aestuariicella hydrocarbonica]|uniref:tRNA threonylcarbamoyladenosine dehydratase n=1 Tax=Pseudomaricurvus hydrocarbonicus TaxID=1470433 RepID=A0A9E5JSQ7_9GAMM|nr:tRNA cyclic N6-threonylcarbamoyladenosine(37) synthase TcdA [Aestuariicella hydrocarbonica]NHO64873.1 tRNA cyclic N6-threonylcarbamoyladenosine(37) synthase TcdA [Aestuariicella hydrocarbonica]